MTAAQFDVRTGEVLTPEQWAQTPTEVAILATDTSVLDNASPEVAAVMVTRALQESRQWLAVAMSGTDPTPIAEFKAWAAVIEEATRQKKLGREIELDAAEMVRRSERGIGVAIRNGQDAGEIRKHGDIPPPPTAPYKRTRLGVEELVQPPTGNASPSLRSPLDFATTDELARGVYPVTDGVTDEQFDAAIDEAKAEGNLSRANVVRKVKGQPAPAPVPAGRPEHLRKMRRHDPNRIVQEITNGLTGYVLSVDLIDFDRLDQTQIAAWSGSLATSLQSLNRLSRRLKELDQA